MKPNTALSSRERMRAAVVTGARRFEMVEVPRPQPGPGQVRFRVFGSGVCASNLATWEGMPWTQYPTAPGDMGHEAWGEIDALGDGVQGLKVGDRVAALSYRAYAEYDLADARSVVPLPDSLRDKRFPGEALGCGMNIFRRSGIRSGETVAIVGAGFLGAMVTRLASAAGARVIAISRRPFALEVAREMGASETIMMDDHWRIIEQVRELTGGVFCDRVVEAAGKQWPLDLSAELVRERGTLVIAGYHQDGPRQVNMQMWNWKGLDVVNAHERDPKVYMEGIRAAIDAAASGKLDTGRLITHSFPLEKLDEALNATEHRPDGFLKAVVMP